MSLEHLAEMLMKANQDQEFAAKFSEVYKGGEDFTSIVKFGSENGFEFTSAECKQMYDAIDDQLEDELSDDDLEKVAGGVVSSTAAAAVGAAGVGLAAVAAASAGIAGAGIAIGTAGTAVASGCK